MAGKRSKRFIENEKLLMMRVVREFMPIFEDQKTDPITTAYKKQAWEALVIKYNGATQYGERTEKELQVLYERLKKRANRRLKQKNLQEQQPTVENAPGRIIICTKRNSKTYKKLVSLMNKGSLIGAKTKRSASGVFNVTVARFKINRENDDVQVFYEVHPQLSDQESDDNDVKSDEEQSDSSDSSDFNVATAKDILIYTKRKSKAYKKILSLLDRSTLVASKTKRSASGAFKITVARFKNNSEIQDEQESDEVEESHDDPQPNHQESDDNDVESQEEQSGSSDSSDEEIRAPKKRTARLTATRLRANDTVNDNTNEPIFKRKKPMKYHGDVQTAKMLEMIDMQMEYEKLKLEETKALLEFKMQLSRDVLAKLRQEKLSLMNMNGIMTRED